MNLESVAPILEKIIKDTLQQKRYPFGFDKYKGVGNKVASGKLRDSVQVVTKTNNNITVLQVLMEQYGAYVQSGRKPGKDGVPIGSLIKWIKERGLTGRNKKGRFITQRSFAFAIQTNIKKFGIRPANFIDYSLESIMENDQVKELIGDAAYEELIDLIEGL